MFTAWDDDGALDPDAQRRLLDFVVERGGVSACFVRSGMGQSYAFSFDEAKLVIQTACNHLRDSMPVLAGCMGVWDRDREALPFPETYLHECIALGEFAAECGAQAAVFHMPEALAGWRPSSDEVVHDYFAELCERVPLPRLIYQPPGTDADFLLHGERLAALAAWDSIAGAKVSYSDAAYLFELARAVEPHDCEFIVGAETAYYAGLYAGAKSVIGQGAILNPHVLNAVRGAFTAGDRAGALQAQETVNALCAACRNPQDFFKRYASEQGYAVGRAARAKAGDPYGRVPAPLDNDEYRAFLRVYEEAAAHYPAPA